LYRCAKLTAIISKGYEPAHSAGEDLEQWDLFWCNIDLILNNKQKIFDNADYFFCSPTFSSCSWPYSGNDGQLFVGYLLIGWQANILTEKCPGCGRGALIVSFAGSPLSGSNSWTGFCINCRRKEGGEHSAKFSAWMDFVHQVRRTFPDKVSKVEDYQSQEFDWEKGLKPVVKKKVVQVPVAEPVNFATLLLELKAATIRKGRPVNVHLIKQEVKLKLSKQIQCANQTSISV
jgi:hypothetical protein